MGGWTGQQAVIFKVRLGLELIEGRDRETERQRDRETKTEIEIHRNKETKRQS